MGACHRGPRAPLSASKCSTSRSSPIQEFGRGHAARERQNAATSSPPSRSALPQLRALPHAGWPPAPQPQWLPSLPARQLLDATLFTLKKLPRCAARAPAAQPAPRLLAPSLLASSLDALLLPRLLWLALRPSPLRRGHLRTSRNRGRRHHPLGTAPAAGACRVRAICHRPARMDCMKPTNRRNK